MPAYPAYAELGMGHKSLVQEGQAFQWMGEHSSGMMGEHSSGMGKHSSRMMGKHSTMINTSQPMVRPLF